MSKPRISSPEFATQYPNRLCVYQIQDEEGGWSVSRGMEDYAVFAYHQDAILYASILAYKKGEKRRPSWDSYGLMIAKAVSLRGDCTRRQVGVVILNSAHRIMATGYNGMAPGEPGCLTNGACPRGQLSLEEAPRGSGYKATNCTATHAEVNALQQLQPSARRGETYTLYTTYRPCAACTEYINRFRRYLSVNIRVVYSKEASMTEWEKVTPEVGAHFTENWSQKEVVVTGVTHNQVTTITTVDRNHKVYPHNMFWQLHARP